MGDVASQTAGTDAAYSEDVCHDDAERHAVYALALYYAQGKIFYHHLYHLGSLPAAGMPGG